MKKTNIIISIIFLLAISMCFCTKENPDNGEHEPLVYTSLEAVKDTIMAGESVHITATASGYELVYYWEGSKKSEFVGSGAEVDFIASPCTLGENTITCTIQDGDGNQESRQITLLVI